MVRVALAGLARLTGIKFSLDREKSSSFECGFDPSRKAHVPFSTRFFIVIIIFLIFDVEVALLLPLILSLWTAPRKSLLFGSFWVCFILTAGLIHEWNQGALKWLSWGHSLYKIFGLQSKDASAGPEGDTRDF